MPELGLSTGRKFFEIFVNRILKGRNFLSIYFLETGAVKSCRYCLGVIPLYFLKVRIK